MKINRYSLPELLQIAQEKNPIVAGFRANLAASRGESLSARAYTNPEGEIEMGGLKQEDYHYSLELAEKYINVVRLQIICAD